jgi:hypothetical protein
LTASTARSSASSTNGTARNARAAVDDVLCDTSRSTSKKTPTNARTHPSVSHRPRRREAKASATNGTDSNRMKVAMHP